MPKDEINIVRWCVDIDFLKVHDNAIIAYIY